MLFLGRFVVPPLGKEDFPRNRTVPHDFGVLKCVWTSTDKITAPDFCPATGKEGSPRLVLQLFDGTCLARAVHPEQVKVVVKVSPDHCLQG